MSRIHEALKKAEQDRAATQGGGIEPALRSAAVLEAAALSEAAVATMPPPISTGSTPAFSGAYSLDELLARCPPQEWKPDLSTMLFMNGNDGTHGTEQYRTLRSRLYQLREKTNLKSILVTSALPQEGKSFTASNLAQVLVRQHGRRVLLVDADLRGPRLHQMLGTKQGPGLAEYLLAQSDEFSIMQRGLLADLFFIPSGVHIENPAELVANGRLRLLLQRVAPLFDWIVIDSPPAVPVSDASVLATACDGVLMVVRANVTPSDVARKARMEFPDQSLIGVVLNGADNHAAPYSRYYYEVYETKATQKV